MTHIPMHEPRTIQDRVYGTHTISAPVLLELLDSAPVQRMAGIGQFGIPDEFYHRKNFSRLEHCIGVMLLLKILGASEEEQIAGLLHDISHTAFSHVVDWVVGSGRTEDYQDTHHQQLICSSKIAPLLQRYGYDPERIANYHHFPLLERTSPDLCADRVDYALREFPAQISAVCFPSLITHEDMIVFGDAEAGRLFSKAFLDAHINHWGGLEATSRYKLFAQVIHYAFEDHLIEFDDFWKDDIYVTERLKAASHSGIQRILSSMRTPSMNSLPRSEEVTHKKFRYVDPLVFHQDTWKRVTEYDLEFEGELEMARIENEKGIHVAILPN